MPRYRITQVPEQGPAHNAPEAEITAPNELTAVLRLNDAHGRENLDGDLFDILHLDGPHQGHVTRVRMNLPEPDGGVRGVIVFEHPSPSFGAAPTIHPI